MKNLKYNGLMFIAFLTFIGCRDGKDYTGNQQAADEDTAISVSSAQFEANGMVFGKMQKREFPTMVEAAGMIDVPPENRSVVTAVMGGYIKNVALACGRRGKKRAGIAHHRKSRICDPATTIYGGQGTIGLSEIGIRPPKNDVRRKH